MVRQLSAGDKPIGVLLFSGSGKRLKGDPGFPGTFPFPVLYGMVAGSYQDLIEGSPEARRNLCAAAEELIERGAAAIAGDCGLMALYQQELTGCSKIPTASSSLILLPLIRQMINSNSNIGILTGHSQILCSRHLRAAGITSQEGLYIQGMQDEPHFFQTVIEGNGQQDYKLMKRDVLRAAEKLLAGSGKTGAVLLECSNLSTYAYEITKEFSLPVFDINSLIWMLHDSFHKSCCRPPLP